MTEEQIRAIVREEIERLLGRLDEVARDLEDGDKEREDDVRE